MNRLATLVRRIPSTGRVCAAVAFVNALIWSIVVPPFHVPDEIAHFGYAQYLAETGRPPPQAPGAAQYSEEQQTAMERLHFFTAVGRSDQRLIWTTPDDRALRQALSDDLSRKGQGGASSATNQPPLYYALVAAAYRLSPSTGILDRLAIMRVISALMAAGTVLCAFLLVREVLPSTPWAWTTGALAVAFQPMFMFIAAGVHGDNLLFLASAALLLLLARTFRRGLTLQRAIAIGTVTAVGILGKLTFLAFLPAVALALGILVVRSGRRQGLAYAGMALAVAVAPVVLYLALNATVWERGGGATAGVATTVTAGAISLRQRISYIWQEVFPRLPFMYDAIPGYAPWSVWHRGFVGQFGWLDYGFPGWVYEIAAVIYASVLSLALVSVARSLRARGWAGMSWRRPLAVVFAVMAAGLLFVIGWQGVAYRVQTGFPFEQGRYLLPLLGLYAIVVGLAVSGAGRRWGPPVGAVLVVLAMAHGLFAMLLTISRYYG